MTGFRFLGERVLAVDFSSQKDGEDDVAGIIILI